MLKTIERSLTLKHSGNKQTELTIFYCPKAKLSSNIGIFSIKK